MTFLSLRFLLLVLACSSLAHALIPVGAKINRLPVGLKEFRDIVVLSVTPEAMTLKHSQGIDQVMFTELTPELRTRLGYDPGAAIAYREEIERERKERERFESARRARNKAKLKNGEPTRTTSSVHIHRNVDMRPVFRKFDMANRKQGRRPSSSIFSVVSALEYEFYRIEQSEELLSEEFLIWATMSEAGGVGNVSNPTAGDAGFAVNSVLHALMKHGIASSMEMSNRYSVAIHDVKVPEPLVLESARNRRSVISVQTILGEEGYIKVNTVMKALNRQRPVVVGVMFPPPATLQESFVLDGQAHHIDYAHAVTLVGYSNETGKVEDTRFIFKNSWGLEWGNRGYGIVSYPYLVRNLRDTYVLEIVGMEKSKEPDLAPSASIKDIMNSFERPKDFGY